MNDESSTVPQLQDTKPYGPVWEEAYNNAYQYASERYSDARERHIYAAGYADGAVVATKSAVEAIERA